MFEGLQRAATVSLIQNLQVLGTDEQVLRDMRVLEKGAVHCKSGPHSGGLHRCDSNNTSFVFRKETDEALKGL